jgi:MFS family permease
MNSAAAGAIAAAIVVPIAMALLARRFPPTIAIRPETSLEALKPKFSKWETGLTVLYMALWVPVTGAIWLPLQAASGFVAQLLGPADFRITPGPIFWFIPAFFLALAVAALPATRIAKRLLGERFTEYETYLQLKHKMDFARVNRLACIAIGWLVAIAVALGLNWYVLIRSDAFVLNSLLSLQEVVHPYSDIQALQTAPQFIAPNGNMVRRREFLIRFKDGSTWSTKDLPVTLSQSEKRAMLERVSERSGVPIEELRGFGKWVL